MKHAAIGAAVLAALAILLAAGGALAQVNGPPPKGWYGTIPGLYLYCDYDGGKDHVLAVAAGAVRAGKAGFLSGMKAAAASGKCQLRTDPTAAVGESEFLGIGKLDDKSYRMWAVHIGDANGHGWILYDLPAPGPASSRDPPLDPAIYGVGA